MSGSFSLSVSVYEILAYFLWTSWLVLLSHCHCDTVEIGLRSQNKNSHMFSGSLVLCLVHSFPSLNSHKPVSSIRIRPSPSPKCYNACADMAIACCCHAVDTQCCNVCADMAQHAAVCILLPYRHTHCSISGMNIRWQTRKATFEEDKVGENTYNMKRSQPVHLERGR